MYAYTAYGLHVSSEIAILELNPVPEGAPDVRIVLGGVPAALDAPADARLTWTGRPGAWLQEIRGIARYFVADGREIRVEPLGAPEDVRAFLLSSALGALLHQREMFVLHASAVRTGAGAVAVAGPSGAGKSTTLAALLRRGHPMLTDDKTVVDLTRADPFVISGYPALRLWKDALRRFDVDPTRLARVREGLDKYVYRSPAFDDTPAPLRGLYVLQTSRETATVGATRLGAQDAFQAVLNLTYRKPFVDALGLRAAHFAWASRIAATVPVVRLTRPVGRNSVDAVADAVEEHRAIEG